MPPVPVLRPFEVVKTFVQSEGCSPDTFSSIQEDFRNRYTAEDEIKKLMNAYLQKWLQK